MVVIDVPCDWERSGVVSSAGHLRARADRKLTCVRCPPARTIAAPVSDGLQAHVGQAQTASPVVVGVGCGRARRAGAQGAGRVPPRWPFGAPRAPLPYHHCKRGAIPSPST